MADAENTENTAHRARAARERHAKVANALCQVGLVLAGLGVALLGHVHDAAEDDAEELRAHYARARDEASSSAGRPPAAHDASRAGPADASAVDARRIGAGDQDHDAG